MIEKVCVFEEETGRQLPTEEPIELVLQRAVNLLIQEHNDLVVALALYCDRPKAKIILGIESGPNAVQRGEELLRCLLECRHDPNLPTPQTIQAIHA